MSSNIKISLSTVSLRVETTALDEIFDRASSLFAQALPRSSTAKTKRLMDRFYSVGVAAGLIGMGAVYALLLWSCLTVFHMPDKSTNPRNATDYSEDDGPLSSSDDIGMAGSGLAVQPIASPQVIHEAGHAFTALIENVPIHSVGLGLLFCLPSAFVSLNSITFDKLPPLSRMRLAAAGAYHNVVLWTTIAALGWSGLGQVLNEGWTGWGTPFSLYKHVDGLGVAVRSVEVGSDLSQYLYPGDIITRIEDVVLAQSHLLAQRRTPLELWHDLLLHHHHNITISDLPDMGWCVDRKWYKAQPSDCCTNPTSSSLVCFSVTNSTSPGLCLDPFKVFSPPETPMTLVHGRCAEACISADTAVAEDEPDQVCVRAKGVTRIGVVRGGGAEKTVLWGGPSEEIWEQVHVSDIAPCYWFVPSGLPELVALFVSYTSTITLSLFFLNLLPIRHLDGAQFLSAFLDLYTYNGASSSFPLSQAQSSAEEGYSKHDYSFMYDAPDTRPRATRRHTSNTSVPLASTSPKYHETERTGWVGRNRKRIEQVMEAAAVCLVTLVAIGNAWAFSN
ncbi:membrane-bound transcription factor site-2 protease [Ceratobasidium sp. AG-Ba]|nr:membrane-bound transcription factor site-2 protease [Ceratobasidium sp. AG-Ba]